MADVEVDTPLAGLPHVVEDPVVVIGIDDGKLPGEDVRVDITRAQVLEDEVVVRAFGWSRPEVDHHRHPGQLSRLHTIID